MMAHAERTVLLFPRGAEGHFVGASVQCRVARRELDVKVSHSVVVIYVFLFVYKRVWNLRFEYREWKNIHLTPSSSPSWDSRPVATTCLASPSSLRMAPLAAKIVGPSGNLQGVQQLRTRRRRKMSAVLLRTVDY